MLMLPKATSFFRKLRCSDGTPDKGQVGAVLANPQAGMSVDATAAPGGFEPFV